MVDARDSLGFAVVGCAAIARRLGISAEEAVGLCEAQAFPCFRTAGQWAATRRALELYRAQAAGLALPPPD